MRFIYHALRGWLCRTPINGSSHVFHGRVGFLDMDINLHLNNASLIFQTELARWNWLAHSGMLSHAIRNRWIFLIASQSVRYRHEVKAFHKFVVYTDLVAFDDEWIWLTHQVKSNNLSCAHVLVRIKVKKLGGKSTVPPSELFSQFNVNVKNPNQVSEIQQFLLWDEEAAKSMKTLRE
jgi:acyl-CoA thioesterase FadM